MTATSVPIALRRIASSAAIVAAALVAFGAAPPPKRSPADLCRSQFEQAKAGIASFHSLVGPYLETSVQEEILRIEWDEVENDKDWSCLPTLERIRDGNKRKQDAVNKAVKQAMNAWAAASGTAKKQKLPDDQRPWKPEEFKAIGDAVDALKYLDNAIDSAKTAKGSRMSQKLVDAAGKYVNLLPAVLGSAELDKLVPESVSVPCVSRTVSR